MNRTKTKKGFTLVEVMVVVAIVVILATFAIPGMIRTKIAANESIALASCRAIINSCLLYSNDNNLFPETMASMVEPISVPPYIDEKIAYATSQATAKGGYWFTYEPSSGQSSFSVLAKPKNNLTGKRTFFFTEDGVIHYSDSGDASASDPTIN